MTEDSETSRPSLGNRYLEYLGAAPILLPVLDDGAYGFVRERIGMMFWFSTLGEYWSAVPLTAPDPAPDRGWLYAKVPSCLSHGPAGSD